MTAKETFLRIWEREFQTTARVSERRSVLTIFWTCAKEGERGADVGRRSGPLGFKNPI